MFKSKKSSFKRVSQVIFDTCLYTSEMLYMIFVEPAKQSAT